MDTLWLFILQATQAVMSALDTALAPVNALHPVLSIMLLALCTLVLTRFLRKHIVTKRYLRLQEEFQHWYNVRQEALSAHSDPQKAKSLAQNIDKATLNKVYYDYFFEGLLLNLVTTYLPILCVAGYINETFKPERLEQLIGHQSLLVFASPNSVAISPLAWFMLCLVGFWMGKIALSKIKVQIRNRQAEQQAV
jgi:uncharacterized membrane protein (DUF106 family)